MLPPTVSVRTDRANGLAPMDTNELHGRCAGRFAPVPRRCIPPAMWCTIRGGPLGASAQGVPKHGTCRPYRPVIMADRRKRRLLAPLGLGFEFAAVLGTLTVVGLWVDRHYGTAPWGSLVGVGLGLAGGLFGFLKGAKRAWQTSAAPPAELRQPDDSSEKRSGSQQPQAGDPDDAAANGGSRS